MEMNFYIKHCTKGHTANSLLFIYEYLFISFPIGLQTTEVVIYSNKQKMIYCSYVMEGSFVIGDENSQRVNS